MQLGVLVALSDPNVCIRRVSSRDDHEAHGDFERPLGGWEKDAVKEERYFIPTPVHA
jgi:hypothetical protein